MNRKVVTNLRIDAEDLAQIKILAAELGMSINEYINYLIKDLSLKRELLSDKLIMGSKKSKSTSIWKLGEIAREIKSSPMGELSSDDKLIYE